MPGTKRARVGAILTGTALVFALAGGAFAQSRIPFRTQAIFDQQQGGLVLATIDVPAQWQVLTSVRWRYEDVSNPLRTFLRVQSPDGSAWVEFFPVELFYWLQPVTSPVPVGGRSLGMIHAPNIGMQQAMQQFVIGPNRGREPSLRIVSSRPVDPARLAAAFHRPPSPGEAMGVRLSYVQNGRPVEEDVYAMLDHVTRIPYTGAQGTWYESHRTLLYAHAMGALAGQLDGMYPLLTYIVGSLKVDPGWERHYAVVMKSLQEQFNRELQQGYAQIQAAGAASRAISAGNDAMLASMQSQRAAQAQHDARLRAQANTSRDATDGFSQYIRGTERMKDPYWGESEQSYNSRFHWTDGYGNYRSSNDPTFNPNVGAGGGATWQRMEPAR